MLETFEQAVAKNPALGAELAKQRHHTWEGNTKLWFDPASLQFRDVRVNGAQFLDLETSEWRPVWGA